MTDFKLAGIVSAVGLGLGYLLGGRSSQVMGAEGKPTLTPKQIEVLNEMKTNYNGYSYVKVDNKGWDGYKPRFVQALLDKKIISIPKDKNNRFNGTVEHHKAYTVEINPVALEYPYKEPKGFEHYGGALRGTDEFAEYMAKQQKQPSKNPSSVKGDYAITYLESHNDVENQHKYYLLLTSGQNNYTAYGRLPGYGREATMKLDKQPSASKMKELAMKKMKTYQLVGHKYDQIPSEIRAKLENEIGMKSSSPSAEPKQEEKDPYAGMNARQRIFMERRQRKAAETFEAEDNTFNLGDSALKEHFGFVLFKPKRARQMPTHVIYKANPKDFETGMPKKTMCGIYLKGKNTDFNVGWPNHLPLHPEHKSGGCKKCYEIMNNMLNKKSAETFEADMSVGNEMLRQLGGRRFMMMVGAKQPIWDGNKNELSMKIGRNALGANYFTIRLNPKDLYDLRFESRRMNRKTYEMSVKVKAEHNDVYADQLQEIFENTTGLYTRMAESFEAESEPKEPKVKIEKDSKYESNYNLSYRGFNGTLNKIWLDGGKSYRLRAEIKLNPNITEEIIIGNINAINNLYWDEDEQRERAYENNSETFGGRQAIKSLSEGKKRFKKFIDKLMAGNRLRCGVTETWLNPKNISQDDLTHKLMPYDSLLVGMRGGVPIRAYEPNIERLIGREISKEDAATFKPRTPLKNRRQIIFEKRKGMGAEYQPDQEIGDYSVSEIAKSSAIEGYQPNKYSFGPIGYGAESISSLKLKKDSCCCGATKKTPCVCMILGSDCSAKKPMCACYRLKRIQQRDEKGAETFNADGESTDSIPKPNPADKEEAFAWVKREHPHIKTDADREMEGVDYAAMTYHPEELEAGAINALKAGDFEAAERFVKALNRQNFIKAFQAEKNR